MIVRLQLKRGPEVKREGRKNRQVALATSALLTPGALTACALGVWRLAADLRLAGQFAIADGLFSHWQVWLGITVVVQSCSILLKRYGADREIFRASSVKAEKTLVDSGFEPVLRAPSPFAKNQLNLVKNA